MALSFTNQTIYSGTSLKTFNMIRDKLDANNIKYKYRLNSHNDVFVSFDRGTIRSQGGNFEKNAGTMYEILVAKKDIENINAIIKE